MCFARTIIDIRLWSSRKAVIAVKVYLEECKIMQTVRRAKRSRFPSFFLRNILACERRGNKVCANYRELKGDIITLPNFSYINQESPKQNYFSPSPFSLLRSSQSRHWRSFSPSRATSTLDIARDSCHKDSATLRQDDKSRGNPLSSFIRAAKAAPSSSVHQRSDVAVAATFCCYTGCHKTACSFR